MQTDPKKVILDFLDIIGFSEDKDAHAEKLLQTCQERAFIAVVSKLPEEKQKEMAEELQGKQSPEEVSVVIQKYASKEEFAEALKTATHECFQEYLQNVLPTLSEEQLKKADDYFAQLSSQNQPSV